MPRPNPLFITLVAALFVGCDIESVEPLPLDEAVDEGQAPLAQGDARAFPLVTSKWQMRRVPVCWENPTPDNLVHRTAVRDAVEETWMRVAAIDFVGWRTCAPVSDGIRIRWSDELPHVKGLGVLSSGVFAGMVLNHEFVQWPCSFGTTTCVYNIAVHEFGHALGLGHEQNRSDNPPDCFDNGDVDVFDPDSGQPDAGYGDFEFGDYDATSVMNYCNLDWNNNGVLSVKDMAVAKWLYGSRYPHADFDNDGYADLVIGIPDEDIGSIADAGSVAVLYGSSTGLSATGDQDFDQDDAGVEGTCEVFDRFGQAVAVGDFNGDGYTDLVSGLPYEDVGSLIDAGAFNVLYGARSGLSSASDAIFDGNGLGIGMLASTGDRLAEALAVGDFDNDGYADLAVGAPSQDGAPWLSNSGAVHILRGAPAGFGIPVTNERIDRLMPQLPSDGAVANDAFGAVLTTGDFNGDGYDDLVVGTPDDDVSGHPDGGSVTVVYGTNNGLIVSTGSQWLHQDSPGVAGIVEPNDRFGAALAAGDFNRDGYDDLAVGVPDEDIGSAVDAGMVHVFLGGASGLVVPSSNNAFDQNHALVAGTAEAGDRFGKTLVVADFDHDGFGDLAVGAPSEALGAVAEAGTLHVLFGGASGLSATGSTDWNQDSTSIIGVAEAQDRFASSLTAGDYDADGVWDLVVGVPDEDIGSIQNGGSVQVLYGSPVGPDGARDQDFHQNSTNVNGVVEGADKFGHAVR